MPGVVKTKRSALMFQGLSARCCTVFTRYPLYRESALRNAKICRLVLGLLNFSVLVFVFFLPLVLTQSFRNYCSRGSQKYFLACKNRNEFESDKTEFNEPSTLLIHPNMMLYCLCWIYLFFMYCSAAITGLASSACLVCLPNSHTQNCLHLFSMGTILNYNRRCPCV